MTIIIAHRGFADNCRENTLEAYQKAIEVGADAIELDIRKTRDNVFISFHDEFICKKQIAQLTYVEINDLARSLNFNVPTLEEVLKLVRGKINLDIELKEKGYEIEVINLILEYLTIEQFIVTSFHLESLLTIKNNYTRIKTGIILDEQTVMNFNFKCNLDKLEFLVLPLGLLSKNFVKTMLYPHKSILVWTINEAKAIKKILKNPKILGIITDRPELAISLKNKINNF